MNNYILFIFILLSFCLKGQEFELQIPDGHNDRIAAIAFSPDDKYLVSGSWDRTVIVWEIASKKQLKKISTHTDFVTDIEFSANGKILATTSKDGIVILWEFPKLKKLVAWQAHGEGANHVKFTNGDTLLTCSDDNTIKLWKVHFDSQQVEQIKSFEKHVSSVNAISLFPDNRRFASGSQNGKLIIWDKSTGQQELSYNLESLGYGIISITSIDISKDGNYLICSTGKWHKQQPALVVFDFINKQTTPLFEHNEYTNYVVISQDNQYFFSGARDGNIIQWSLPNKKPIRKFSTGNHDILTITITPKRQQIAVGIGNKVCLGNFESQIKFTDYLGGMIAFFYGLKYLNNGIVQGGDNKDFRYWDFNSGKVFTVSPSYLNGEAILSIAATDTLLLLSTASQLHFVDASLEFSLLESLAQKSLISMDIHPTGAYAIAISNQGILKHIDINSKKVSDLFSLGAFQTPPKVVFSKDESQFLVSTLNQLLIFETNSWKGKVLYEAKQYRPNEWDERGQMREYIFDALFTPDSQFVIFASSDGTLGTIEIATSTLKKRKLQTFSKPYYSFYALAIVGQQLLTGGTDGEINLWSLDNFKLLKHIGNHQSEVIFLDNTKSENSFYSYSSNGELKLWTIGMDKKASNLTCLALKNDEFIIMNEEQYYFSSKLAASLTGFSYKDIRYDFEQFDLKYNRPDVILSELSSNQAKLTSTYQKAYFNAYQKRLSKNNFAEEKLSDGFHTPMIQLSSKGIPISTQNSTLEIKIKAQDTLTNLDRLNLWINDVPLHGIRGINLRDQNIKEWQQDLTLTLSQGENKIQVSALNQGGAESLKETFYVTYEPPQERKPHLHLIALGTAQHQAATHNLTFPTKDVAAITALFNQPTDLYEKVHIQTLTNEQVTLENVQALKAELMQTHVDDVVILFYAGHGLLDAEYDYYLATYDVNFSNPKEGGLPYEELENLLDGIPARQKLLLMDACHSGEIDTEYLKKVERTNEETDSIRWRTTNADSTIAYAKLGIENSFELMKELFVDLRRGTGATVISSAGGVQEALESSQWGNGAFTFALKEGLLENKENLNFKLADDNEDGDIQVAELQNYLRDRVPKMTNGLQQPTSRVFNISNDFRIW